ncbi:MAG: hypothetical protein JNK48_20445, partial [Bryobacterales bacterium]|nr:hypothetical protein [Bryobacterales bacterium]
PDPRARADSAKLLTGDEIFIAIGDKHPQGASGSVQSIEVAVTFGRALARGGGQNLATPFSANGGPQALFLGAYPPVQGMSVLSTESYQYQDKDGSLWTVDWWVLPLGAVADAPPSQHQDPFTFMVGARVVTNSQATLYFSHDPEIDVGTEQALGQYA